MIETGTVSEVYPDKAAVLVDFHQLNTTAECLVLQPTTGNNAVFYLPSQGTQVVCWLEGGKKIVLGALFSDADPVPAGVDQDTEIRQFGKSKVTLKDDTLILEQDQVSIELTGNKASLKNTSTGLKTILKDILSAIKTLTVSTGVGPSGTPLPPTIQAVLQLEQKVNNLLND